MNIKIKRFDKTLPLPRYHTKGSVCMDLYVREEIKIKPGKTAYIPMNIAIEVPSGYWTMVLPRSSMHKRGLMVANSVGVIDEDYCGDNDEINLIVYNFTKDDVIIEKGARIAQFMVVGYEKMNVEEVDSLKNPDRNGIGSTG